MAAITRLLGLPDGNNQLTRATGGAKAGTGGIDSAELLFESFNLAAESAAQGSTDTLELGYYPNGTDATGDDAPITLIGINGNPDGSSYNLLLGQTGDQSAKVLMRAETLNFEAVDHMDDPTTAVMDGHWSVGTSNLMGQGPDGHRNSDIYGKLTVHGDMQIEGTTTTINSTEMTVTDNMVLFNSGPSAHTALAGWAVQSHSSDAASESGNNYFRQIVGGFDENNAIGDQGGLNNTSKIVIGDLENISSLDDIYNGMWIKIDDAGQNSHGDIREIIDYVGSTKTATVKTPFTSQVRAEATAQVYIDQVGMVWDETQNRFTLSSIRPDGSLFMGLSLQADTFMAGYALELSADGANQFEPGSFDGAGSLYVQTVDDIEELFFVSEDGQSTTMRVQLTSNGGVNAAITGDLEVDGNATINVNLSDDQIGYLKVRWDSDSDSGEVRGRQVALEGTADSSGSDIVQLRTRALSVAGSVITEGDSVDMVLRLGDGLNSGNQRSSELKFHGRSGGGNQIDASLALHSSGDYEGNLVLDEELVSQDILPVGDGAALGAVGNWAGGNTKRFADAFLQGLDVQSDQKDIHLEVKDANGGAKRFLKLTSSRVAGNVGKLVSINAATALAERDLVCITSSGMSKADASAQATAIPSGIMLDECENNASILGKVSAVGFCAAVTCVAPGASTAAGVAVYLSTSPGKVQFIMPDGEGDYVMQVGVAHAATGAEDTSVVIQFLPDFLRIANGS